MTLRQSIKKSVMEQSKLLDNIGTAEMEREVQKRGTNRGKEDIN